MRGKSIALLALALGCGLVASIGITQVMAKRDVASGDGGDTAPIFVALEDIEYAEPITAQLLRMEEWPADKVPPGALTRLEDIEGRLARTKLFAGEPMNENKLFGVGENAHSVSLKIPAGMRVVPVRVDKESGGHDMIMPGDRVDVVVFVTRCPAKQIPETGIRSVLQNIKVFAVNNVVDTSSDGEKAIAAQTISVLVTPRQANKLMLATELGKVRMVMKNTEDDEELEDIDVSPADIFDGAEVADREQESPSAPDPIPTGGGKGFLDFLSQMQNKKTTLEPAETDASMESWGIRMVRGTEVSDVVLQRESADGDANENLTWKLFGGELGLETADADVCLGPTCPTDGDPSDEPDEQDEEQAEPEDGPADLGDDD